MRGGRGRPDANRILVYGVTGSGKSTAALRIGEVTGLPVTLVDELTWHCADLRAAGPARHLQVRSIRLDLLGNGADRGGWRTSEPSCKIGVVTCWGLCHTPVTSQPDAQGAPRRCLL